MLFFMTLAVQISVKSDFLKLKHMFSYDSDRAESQLHSGCKSTKLLQQLMALRHFQTPGGKK